MFKRIFGSWQNACIKAGIPYGLKKINIEESKYHRKSNRVGEEKIDRYGCVVKIIEYNNANDITIEFQDDYKWKVKTTYGNWKENKFRNNYSKTYFGIGYIGNTCTRIGGIKKDSYKVWYSMLQRCYKECFTNKPTYLKCFVCDEWHCYESFEKWYDVNFYKVKNEQMMLDKDILIKNNFLYCPEKCIFVPQSINKSFTKRQLHRGLYPIGVSYNKRDNCYVARCNNGHRHNEKHIGVYNNPYDAFQTYKKYKEKLIKEIANNYKNDIPQRLYDALIDYSVDITD